jgi:hypothetical protein
MTVFFGLLFVVFGVLGLTTSGGVGAMGPGWVPTLRELSVPIAIAEILFGLGLVYSRTRRLFGLLLASVVLITWCLTLYFVLIPEDAVTVSKGEIPAQSAEWKLTIGQRQEGRRLAQLDASIDPPGIMRIRIASTTPERKAWDIQLNRNGISVLKDQEYRLRFHARASGVRPINAAVGRAHGDYGTLGIYREVAVMEDWQHFELGFKATADDANARIFFDVGQDPRDVELSNVTLTRNEEKAQNGESASASPNPRSHREVTGGGRTRTSSLIAVYTRTAWLQIFSKPLWILVLLWCSGWLRLPHS